MKEINEAYEILTDINKRKVFDDELSRISVKETKANEKSYSAADKKNSTATRKEHVSAYPQDERVGGKRTGLFAIAFGVVSLLIMVFFPVIAANGSAYSLTGLLGACVNQEDIRVGCMFLLLVYAICIFYTVKSFFAVLMSILTGDGVSKDIFGYVLAFCIFVGGFAWLAGDTYSCHPIVYPLLIGCCAGVSINR